MRRSFRLAVRDGFPPDVILLDIGLPEMDGYEVARGIRATPGFADTSLIAHSGYAGEEHLHRVRQAGFDYHLVKPADVARLNELKRHATLHPSQIAESRRRTVHRVHCNQLCDRQASTLSAGDACEPVVSD
ncbi:response regulator [Paraburkholderia sp. IW21]|uniref:response regulator n=1 Tax=Paraburkholderia sp. IW21 TaxID=3242488 RepID=UPI0035205091